MAKNANPSLLNSHYLLLRAHQITETGIRTFFGRASQLMSEVDKKRSGGGMLQSGGHFQQLVTKLTLGLLCLSIRKSDEASHFLQIPVATII